MDNSSYSRNKPSSNKNEVDEEVQKLFRKGAKDNNEFVKLRSKYNNEELADKIQSAFLEKQQKIIKKAKKFAQLIREKYSNKNYPFHMLLEKALKFKSKYSLSDDEFAEFKKIYEQELVGSNAQDVMVPTTNMMKLLGTINMGIQENKMKVSDDDYKHLQTILKMFSEQKPLHSQVMLQSFQYKDCDYEAVTGEYKRELGHRPGEHVHPIIAALFIPKIKNLEEHFLYSNMARIMKNRYNQETLNSMDMSLYYYLTQDPNDVVCSNTSPMLDFLNRCHVQQHLWNSVLHLRNGQYYNTSFRDFISSIDICRLNRYDNPDLVYGRHDGTVIKRLLSTFSYRPTTVATSNVYQLQVFSTNPYQQTMVPNVTSVPMINLKLPITLNDNSVVSLQDALSQNQFFLEGNSIVPKQTEFIYSRGVLIFYVDRKANIMDVKGYNPFNMNVIPNALSAFEKMSDRYVNFEESYDIRGDKYNLRSVVVNEISNQMGSNIIVGSSTLVMRHADINEGRFQNEYMHYNPLSVVDFTGDSNDPHSPPVTQIRGTPNDMRSQGNSFEQMASERGCIFIYELAYDSTSGVYMN